MSAVTARLLAPVDADAHRGAETEPADPMVSDEYASLQRSLGELASTLAAHIGTQKEAHDRVSGRVVQVDSKLTSIEGIVNGLASEFRVWKATPTDVTKVRLSLGVTYSIVATALMIAAVIWGVALGLDAKTTAAQAAIGELRLKLEAQDKVAEAERRLRDFKEATAADALARVERQSQLNDVQIRARERQDLQRR